MVTNSVSNVRTRGTSRVKGIWRLSALGFGLLKRRDCWGSFGSFAEDERGFAGLLGGEGLWV